MIKKRNIDQNTRLADLGEILTYNLTGGAADSFALAVQNPYTDDLLITRAILDITTAGGTATAVIDVDVVGTATSTGDDIFDGVDANATGIKDNLNDTDNGTNGDVRTLVWEGAGKTNDYVTAKILVEAATALVGKLHLYVQKR